MRTLTMTAFSIAIAALPLCAQNTTAAAGDSPLVAAAKASSHPAKKGSGIMITNDNLVRVGGHITSTTSNIALPAPPAPDTSASALAAAAIREKAALDAKAKKEPDAKEKRLQQLRQAGAEFNGESIESRTDDPAMQEHLMEQLHTGQTPEKTDPSHPQTVQGTKPDLSTNTTKPPQN